MPYKAMFKGNKWLLVNGKLALSNACCCPPPKQPGLPCTFCSSGSVGSQLQLDSNLNCPGSAFDIIGRFILTQTPLDPCCWKYQLPTSHGGINWLNASIYISSGTRYLALYARNDSPGCSPQQNEQYAAWAAPLASGDCRASINALNLAYGGSNGYIEAFGCAAAAANLGTFVATML